MSFAATLQPTQAGFMGWVTGNSGSGTTTAGGTVDASSYRGDAFSSNGIEPIGIISSVFGATQVMSAVNGGASVAGVVSDTAGKFGKTFTAIRGTFAQTALIGTAVGAAISVVTNGIDVIKGRTSGGVAAGRVISDTVGAAVSTAGSVLIGGAATAALAAVGVAGLPLTLAGLGVSTIAGLAANAAYRRSGLNRAISGTVASALGG